MNSLDEIKKIYLDDPKLNFFVGKVLKELPNANIEILKKSLVKLLILKHCEDFFKK